MVNGVSVSELPVNATVAVCRAIALCLIFRRFALWRSGPNAGPGRTGYIPSVTFKAGWTGKMIWCLRRIFKQTNGAINPIPLGPAEVSTWRDCPVAVCKKLTSQYELPIVRFKFSLGRALQEKPFIFAPSGLKRQSGYRCASGGSKKAWLSSVF